MHVISFILDTVIIAIYTLESNYVSYIYDKFHIYAPVCENTKKVAHVFFFFQSSLDTKCVLFGTTNE